MSQEGTRPPHMKEWLLAAIVCMVGALFVLWEPLVGDASTLSFDEAHPGYPAPWLKPSAGERPLINPITSDGDFLVLPGLMRLAQLEAAGNTPWWDNRQLLGYPLGANQTYPIDLPYAAWLVGQDPVDSLDWLLWFHMALAAFSAYRAVRVLNGSRTAGALAAVGFSLSTWMITRWHLPQITYTTACWPGLVVAVEWLRRGRWGAAVAEGALWIGLSLLAGFPQVGMIYLAGFLLLVVLERRLWKPVPFLSAGLAAALGLALAAPLLNAVQSVYPVAARTSDRAKALTAQSGLQPAALIGMAVPEFFGRPSDFSTADPPAPSMQAYWPRRLMLTDDVQDNPVEDALYPGVALLLLFPLLLRRGVDPRAKQLGAAAALSVLGALAIPFAVDLVPGLEGLGSANSKRAVVLWAGCVPLAAGLALDALCRRRVATSWWPGLSLLALLLGLVTVVTLNGEADAPDFLAALRPQAARQAALIAAGSLLLWWASRGRSWAGPALVLLLFVDLVTLAWVFNPFPPQFEHFGERPSLSWLAQQPGRVAVVGQRRVLPPSAAGLHGIRSLHGSVPMLGRRQAELFECMGDGLIDWRDPRSVEPFPNETMLDHALLDLFEVGTVVHADPGMAARRGWPNDYESVDEGLAAFRRPGAGPRAFLCGGAVLLPSAPERLAWLSRPDAPVHATVVLESDPGITLPATGEMLPVQPRLDEDGHILLDVEADWDGVLVVVESWHDGWELRVDGEVRDLSPVDHALLGVPLTAGRHEVEFRFDLPGRRTAGWIQLLALLAVGVALCKRGPSPAAAN